MESKDKISIEFNLRGGTARGTIRTIRGALGSLSEQEVMFGGPKSPNTAPRDKLGSYQ
jgi:hypothetical protein